jgi:protein-arginine kinase activator protein McsA
VPSAEPVDKPLDKTKQLALLHQRLEKALVHEDYEQAALLRDEIKALKQAPEDKPASE